MARDLIDELRSQVIACHQGDPSAILADRALAEAGELLRRSTTDDGGMPLGVAEVVAWVRYMRSVELTADQRRADLQAELDLFGAIAQVDWTLLPADILRRLTALRRQHRDLAGALDRCRAALDEPSENVSVGGLW